MNRIAFLLPALFIFAGHTHADETSLIKECTAEFKDPRFDCGCAIKYLETRFPDNEIRPVLAAWAYSLDGRRDHFADFTALDTEYNDHTINQLLLDFHMIRTGLLMKCPSDGPDGEDDQ